MEARAAIPVSLPRDSPTRSYWQEHALDREGIADWRSSDVLPASADVVIVGSGITGAAVAWNLLEDQPRTGPYSILMLEARQACSGATGRNGGHTKAASYRSFLDHAQKYGTAMAAKIARLELANIRAVHAFARDHGIRCGSNPCETVDIIYDPAQWAQAQEAVTAMRDAMPGDAASAYTLHGPEEVLDRFLVGGRNVCGGVSYEAGSLSAYEFVIGVLGLCLKRGLNLHTNTPVLGLSRTEDGHWLVDTYRGVVQANRVVLATNGYTARLVEELQGVIVPLRGHVTAQRPGTKLAAKGLSTTYSFIYEGGYEYMIPRSIGEQGRRFDIVIGGGLTRASNAGTNEYGTTDDAGFDQTVRDYLGGCLADYFGHVDKDGRGDHGGGSWGRDDPEGRVRREWTGIMGYSVDGMPLVGEVPGEGKRGLWMAASFQGHGMVLCWMCAAALVQMMQESGAGQARERTGGEAAQGASAEARLGAWFPEVFRVSQLRLGLTFRGRLHTTAPPQPTSNSTVM